MATLANSVIDRSMRTASAALLEAGAQTQVASLQGVEALFFYRLDSAENARRQHVAAARLDRMAPLETLLDLPVDIPVPLALLDTGQRRAVRALPTGSADRDRTSVTRRAVRPASVDLAVVWASGVRQGLRDAGRFAPFCRRAMLLTRRPPRLDEALAEADFYGIGVFITSGDGIEMVLEPAAYRPQRHTAAAWCFVEELYQLLP
ncbi:hypothetical protein HEP85_38885 [Streptomyces sp. RPA4-2]|uniref:hypothetical protein n=1 Tax=Streptomyces sp. RPA4-2 TaxID=2721244 RepID=UPI00143EA274|nr:hypothetical protein [Streptomyces sp. RPA4-2]QIY66409.1 hypothetical protein HEP85_38885 [Streptomyces sp. RPA4-2]